MYFKTENPEVYMYKGSKSVTEKFKQRIEQKF